MAPAPELRRDRLGLLVRAARELGDVAQLKFGTRGFYFFVHPDAIQHILVTHHRNYPKGPDQIYLKPVIGEGLITSEGSHHLHQRRMLQPGFHRTQIVTYARTMTAFAADMLDQWRHDQVVDLYHEMMQLTLRIVIRTLCGVDLADPADHVGQSMQSALALFGAQPETLLPSTRRATRELDDVIYHIIRRRRDERRDADDLLTVLLAAANTPGGDGEQGMTDRQIRDEVMTLFFAGHDTTASALSWSWYLLAQHPEIEAKLHAELAETLGGRLPTVDDIPRLSYTTMVFTEALRLFPPIWSISRQTIADDEIGGYRVPAGMPVMISPYVTHHDPRFYVDPDRFDPARFHPDHDVRKQIPRQAYVPFGAGLRQCMGEPYAWMEGTLLLATIAQRFRFHLVPDHAVIPQSMITLRPKNGVLVTLHAR